MGRRLSLSKEKRRERNRRNRSEKNRKLFEPPPLEKLPVFVLDAPVCDCYAQWKQLQAAGVNTTELLSNKLNHPTREMNWLFAVSLLRSILGGE